MYDRPSAAELIEAARQHFETQIIPLTRSHNSRLYFQTLVAVNVMKIVERELALASGHAEAEWVRLDMLLGAAPAPQTSEAIQAALAQRNEVLCRAIRAGEHDANAALFSHLKACATEQLQVANPRFLSTLATEDAAKDY